MSASAGSSGRLLKRLLGSNEGRVGFSSVSQHQAKAVSHTLLTDALWRLRAVQLLLPVAFAGQHCPLRLSSNISLNSVRNTFPGL